MSGNPYKRQIIQGEQLYQQGKYAEALEIFESVIEQDPENVEALNDAGVTYLELNEIDSAIEVLSKAVEIRPDNENAILTLLDCYVLRNNTRKAQEFYTENSAHITDDELKSEYEKIIFGNRDIDDNREGNGYDQKIKHAEDLFAKGQIDEASDIFSTILKEDPENELALNNLAVIHHQQGDTERSQKYIEKAYNLNPTHQDIIENFASIIGYDSVDMRDSTDTINIAFICGPDTKFLLPIEEQLADSEKYDVKWLHFTNQVDLQQIQRLMDWADIIWFEWCDQIVLNASQQLRKTSHVICRLHRYESFTGIPQQVRWEFVDHLILVSDPIKDIIMETVPNIEQRVNIVVIPNGVDLTNYHFTKRKKGFDIAYIGYINHRKNPSFLIQAIDKLVRINDNYQLHIAGYYQQLEYQLYMEYLVEELSLQNNVHLYGWVDDISLWLEKKNYLLSTSIHESFGYGIAEAMASGIKPVIHNFPGAKEIFKSEYVFNNLDELVEMITSDKYESENYRQFIKERYSLESQLKQIDQLIENTSSTSKIASEKKAQPGGSNNNRFQSPQRNIQKNRNLIITGIPRSGTSLVASLLNAADNVVCLNEILYNVNTLPQDFEEIRNRLLLEQPIPNKYNNEGSLTTDTQNGNTKIEHRPITKPLDENVIVGSKVNIPYLNQIEKILQYGFNTIAIIRDPAYTVASWNRNQNIPEAMVSDENMHPRWRPFNFGTTNPIERQAKIWEFYARILWKYRDQLKILKYEYITQHPDTVMKNICDELGVVPPENIPELKNYNSPSRYENFEYISTITAQSCPTAKYFGYQLKKPDRNYEPRRYWETRGQNYRVNKKWYNSDQEIPFLDSLIDKYDLRAKPVLEIGAGYGRLYEHLGEKMENFVMCDFVESMREECEKRTGIKPDYWDGHTLPYQDNSFELTILFSVLLHVPDSDIDHLIREAVRVTRKFLYISTYTGDSGQTADHIFRHDYRSLFEKYGLKITEEKEYFSGNRTNWLVEIVKEKKDKADH